MSIVGDLAHDRGHIRRGLRLQVRVELDAREREQIVDQPRHAPRLALHDFHEALARRRIVARRPLQGVDEAGERRERRAQLVAGVGDEIGAHLLDPAQRREVLHADENETALESGRDAGEFDRRDAAGEPAVDRHAFEEFHPLRLVGGDRAADRLDDFRHAQRQRGRFAAPQRRRHAAGVRVEGEHPALAVEHDHRIGQPGDHRLDQRVGEPRAAPLGQRRDGPDRRAPGAADPRGGDDDSGGGERIGEAERAGRDQGNEHEGRGNERAARRRLAAPPGAGTTHRFSALVGHVAAV